MKMTKFKYLIKLFNNFKIILKINRIKLKTFKINFLILRINNIYYKFNMIKLLMNVIIKKTKLMK